MGSATGGATGAVATPNFGENIYYGVRPTKFWAIL